MKKNPLLFALMFFCASSAGAAATLPGQKVLKDPAEFNAYMAAYNTSDPAKKAAAMEAFIAQYPDSIVKEDGLEQALAAYQQAGDQASVETTANRILALDPAHVRALVIRAYLERVRATQGDQAALASLQADAERGLRLLPDWPKPEGTTEAEFVRLRDQLAVILHGAAGFAALSKHDYATARGHYLTSVGLDQSNMQDFYQLSIAELEMKPLEPLGFWHVAKAAALAQSQNNAAGAKAILTYAKAKYRKYHGDVEHWEEIASAVREQSVPPPDFSVKPAPTPPEIAVIAVLQNDPSTLSFADWEYVLGFRDASPANKAAADKVWAAILAKQKNGEARLQIAVKVIAVTDTTLDAAVTDENQQANNTDLHATLRKPAAVPLVVGDIVNVTGVMSDYSPSPFHFIMEHAEVAVPEKPPADPMPAK